MPPPIQKLAAKFLNDPKRVEVARPATANVNIEQRLVEVSADKKKDALRDILRHEEFKNAIIFCNRKTTVRELATSLKRSGFEVGQIQGDMDQSDRIAEFDRFKRDEINILVASDVAARGLDVKGVSHVINFDVPWQPDDYIHRIGRTGRAGMTGIAITLATRRRCRSCRRYRKADRPEDPARRQSGRSANRAREAEERLAEPKQEKRPPERERRESRSANEPGEPRAQADATAETRSGARLESERLPVVEDISSRLERPAAQFPVRKRWLVTRLTLESIADAS